MQNSTKSPKSDMSGRSAGGRRRSGFLAEIRLRTPLKSSQKPSSRSISCKFRAICTLPGRVRTSKRKNPLPSADDQLPSRVRTSKRKNPLCLNIVECVLIKRKAELLGCLDVKSLSTIFQTSSTLAALANDASTWHRVYAARSAAPLQTTARIEKKESINEKEDKNEGRMEARAYCSWHCF